LAEHRTDDPFEWIQQLRQPKTRRAGDDPAKDRVLRGHRMKRLELRAEVEHPLHETAHGSRGQRGRRAREERSMLAVRQLVPDLERDHPTGYPEASTDPVRRDALERWHLTRGEKRRRRGEV